jgi:hypothetical protein
MTRGYQSPGARSPAAPSDATWPPGFNLGREDPCFGAPRYGSLRVSRCATSVR